MEALEVLDNLARRAAAETPPAIRIDMASVLDEARRQRSFLLPLRWSAAISAVAACLVLAAAFCWTTSSARASTPTTTNSVDALFAPVQVEIP